MRTSDILKTLPDNIYHALEAKSFMIHLDRKADNRVRENEDKKRLRGYLECMRDMEIITESGLRLLYLYFTAESEG